MFKKLFAALAAVALAAGTLAGAASAAPIYSVGSADHVYVYVNDAKLQTDQPALMKNGRTMVPMRAIFEALGATIEWNGETQTVTGTKGDTVVQLQLNAPEARVNGQRVALDVPAEMINYRTMVPVRFISESLGAQVMWDGRTHSVFVTQRTLQTYLAVDDYLETARPHLLAISAHLPLTDEILRKYILGEIDLATARQQYADNQAGIRGRLDNIGRIPLPEDQTARLYIEATIQLFERMYSLMHDRGQAYMGDNVTRAKIEAVEAELDVWLGDLVTYTIQYEDFQSN